MPQISRAFIICCAITDLLISSFTDVMHSQITDKSLNVNVDSNSFSDEAQDLLHKILVPDPEKRIKMEDILAEPWYKLEDHNNAPFFLSCYKMQRELAELSRIV